MRKLLRGILLVVGGTLLVYPWIGNWIYEHNVHSQVRGYKICIEEDRSLAQEKWQEAQKYNHALKNMQGVIIYPPLEPVLEHEYYESVLRMDADGLMGFIEIPDICVYLPIYHGTSEEVLKRGAGHLEGSSLPVGGNGTKAVISSHTGMNSAPMFSDLTELENGDIFLLHVLDRTLIYEVSDIEVVLPEETQILVPEQDKDQVTLLTCTPYGQNTHRLLVTGDRISKMKRDEKSTEQKEHSDRNSQWMSNYRHAVCIGIGIVLGIYRAGRIVHIFCDRKCR